MTNRRSDWAWRPPTIPRFIFVMGQNVLPAVALLILALAVIVVCYRKAAASTGLGGRDSSYLTGGPLPRSSDCVGAQEVCYKGVAEKKARLTPTTYANGLPGNSNGVPGSGTAPRLALVGHSASTRSAFVTWLANPIVAFLLSAIGALCVFGETQYPGAVVPGSVGSLLVILGLYGFHRLPIGLTGAVLIALAMILFVMEAKVPLHGVLGVGGMVAAVAGSLLLVNTSDPGMRVPTWLALAIVPPFGLIVVTSLRVAIRGRMAKLAARTGGVIGSQGVAQTAITSCGTAFVRGELWNAKSGTRIEKGQAIEVTGLDRLTLQVEPRAIIGV